MVCLDTVFNLPFLLAATIQDIVSGEANSANRPYKSWNDVHHGAVGTLPPEVDLTTIVQVPAWYWSARSWSTLSVKWNEWIFVVSAIIFFGVFGTTREMKKLAQDCFQTAWRRLGRKGEVRRGPDVFQLKDMSFSSRAAPRR